MRKPSTSRMTKIILSISLIILFGRLIYSAIGAIEHHRAKSANTVVEQPVVPTPTAPR